MLKTTDVAIILGVPFRTLDHWVRSGLLRPSINANGSGTRRGWTLHDVTRAAIIKGLRIECGISLQAIRKSEIIQQLTDDKLIDDTPDRCIPLVVIGNTPYLMKEAFGTPELLQQLETLPGIQVIRSKKVLESIQQAIEKYME